MWSRTTKRIIVHHMHLKFKTCFLQTMLLTRLDFYMTWIFVEGAEIYPKLGWQFNVPLSEVTYPPAPRNQGLIRPSKGTPVNLSKPHISRFTSVGYVEAHSSKDVELISMTLWKRWWINLGSANQSTMPPQNPKTLSPGTAYVGLIFIRTSVW